MRGQFFLIATVFLVFSLLMLRSLLTTYDIFYGAKGQTSVAYLDSILANVLREFKFVLYLEQRNNESLLRNFSAFLLENGIESFYLKAIASNSNLPLELCNFAKTNSSFWIRLSNGSQSEEFEFFLNSTSCVAFNSSLLGNVSLQLNVSGITSASYGFSLASPPSIERAFVWVKLCKARACLSRREFL